MHARVSGDAMPPSISADARDYAGNMLRINGTFILGGQIQGEDRRLVTFIRGHVHRVLRSYTYVQIVRIHVRQAHHHLAWVITAAAVCAGREVSCGIDGTRPSAQSFGRAAGWIGHIKRDEYKLATHIQHRHGQ